MVGLILGHIRCPRTRIEVDQGKLEASLVPTPEKCEPGTDTAAGDGTNLVLKIWLKTMIEEGIE